jgi:hypothetical protein
MQANTQQQFADVACMRELRERSNQALRDIETAMGGPRGSLGAKW